jgi:hypothetical protein
MYRAFIIRPPKRRDISKIIRIGCAEAKKALHTHKNLTVVDILERPYGFIIVVDDGVDAGDALRLRDGKENTA